jgi:hypothetical protein
MEAVRQLPGTETNSNDTVHHTERQINISRSKHDILQHKRICPHSATLTRISFNNQGHDIVIAQISTYDERQKLRNPIPREE